MRFHKKASQKHSGSTMRSLINTFWPTLATCRVRCWHSLRIQRSDWQLKAHVFILATLQPFFQSWVVDFWAFATDVFTYAPLSRTPTDSLLVITAVDLNMPIANVLRNNRYFLAACCISRCGILLLFLSSVVFGCTAHFKLYAIKPVLFCVVEPYLFAVCVRREWAARMQQEKPDYFSSLADQQAPEYFWIGCSDSRVPVRLSYVIHKLYPASPYLASCVHVFPRLHFSEEPDNPSIIRQVIVEQCVVDSPLLS